MDLGFVGHAVERDKEQFRGPAQASGTLQFTHCSAFLRRGFVDLDYADAGFSRSGGSAWMTTVILWQETERGWSSHTKPPFSMVARPFSVLFNDFCVSDWP